MPCPTRVISPLKHGIFNVDKWLFFIESIQSKLFDENIRVEVVPGVAVVSTSAEIESFTKQIITDSVDRSAEGIV